MKYSNSKIRSSKGMSLVEMVLAMAIMVVVMAVIGRQFRPIQSNWGAKQAAAETIQNGRILTDHVNRYLAKAVKITDVSESSVTLGYIQFEATDGNDFRYEVDPNGYVQFGEVNDLSVLAGPVTKFQFTCYDIFDLDTSLNPITDTNDIRFVKMETILSNSASSGRDKTLLTSAFLYTNSKKNAITKKSAFEFESTKAKDPDLAMVDSTHYLCAYAGQTGGTKDTGWAVILTVDTDSWAVTKETPFEYDSVRGKVPVLAQVDSSHYLCAYAGKTGGTKDTGWATVLTVNTFTWNITNNTPFEYDSVRGKDPDLVQIDSTHYLCVYAGKTGGTKDTGWATVLTVDTNNWTITKETPFEYDSIRGKAPTLAQIDTAHYLCVYAGQFDLAKDTGWATVLTVDTNNWTITNNTPFVYDNIRGKDPDVIRIDNTHYLCASSTEGDDGLATILIVDANNWTISKGVSFEYDASRGKKAVLAQMDTNYYFCAYAGPAKDEGWSVVLGVDSNDWTVSKDGNAFNYEADKGKAPDMMQIDSIHYLCVYSGPDKDDGWAIVLEADISVRP